MAPFISLFLSSTSLVVGPSDYSDILAKELRGVVAKGCAQLQCIKDFATARGTDTYVVVEVARIDKRVFLTLRAHQLDLFSAKAKAVRDWAEGAPDEARAAAQALALELWPAAPVLTEPRLLRLNNSPAPSPIRPIGWWLIGSGLAGLATGAILFGVGEISRGVYDANVRDYNSGVLRDAGGFAALQRQSAAVNATFISSYVILGSGVPALVTGIIFVARGK